MSFIMHEQGSKTPVFIGVLSETTGKAGGLKEGEPLKAAGVVADPCVDLPSLGPGCIAALRLRLFRLSTPSSPVPKSAVRRSFVSFRHTPVRCESHSFPSCTPSPARPSTSEVSKSECGHDPASDAPPKFAIPAAP